MFERVAGRLGSRFGRSKPDISNAYPDRLNTALGPPGQGVSYPTHGDHAARRESLASSLHTAYPSDYLHLQNAEHGIPESVYSGASDFTPSLVQSNVDSGANGGHGSGRYKLEDFIIQRTLGTGSFGRVHLSESLLEIPQIKLLTTWL